MKKITFIFVGIVYFVAIIFVAFLGAQAEIANETILVTQIVLKEAENLGKGEHLSYPEGSSIAQSVYTLYTRPNEEDIDPETGKTDTIIWNLTDKLRFDYVVQIRDFNTVCDSPSWKYGPMHFDLGAYALPDNATKKNLRYSLTDSAGSQVETVSINELGVLEFKQRTESLNTFIVTILPTDNSQVSCRVRFMVRGYKQS